MEGFGLIFHKFDNRMISLEISIIKATIPYFSPFILEFLNLNDRYMEKNLENAIMRELEQLLLEMASVLLLDKRALDKDFYSHLKKIFCFNTPLCKSKSKSVFFLIENFFTNQCMAM